MPEHAAMPPAVAAFDAAAVRFDERFGEWRSVASQRRAVRRELLAAFPPGSHVLELAGGTAGDAIWLARQERRVTVTDGSAAMVSIARGKVAAAGIADRVHALELLLEELDGSALRGATFDGAFSNFAGLNCVADLRAVARGLAGVLPPRAPALLVMFGPLPPGEIAVELSRGNVRAAFRRLGGSAGARLGGRAFQVFYPTPGRVARAFAPWFRLHRIRGIGVFVPPSAAEPFISRFPRLLRVLEGLDRLAATPLALLGDHVLLHFVRTDVGDA